MDASNEERREGDEQHEQREQGKQPQDEASPFLATLHCPSQSAGLLQLDAAHRPYAPYQALSQPCICAISLFWSAMIAPASVLISACSPFICSILAASTALW